MYIFDKTGKLTSTSVTKVNDRFDIPSSAFRFGYNKFFTLRRSIPGVTQFEDFTVSFWIKKTSNVDSLIFQTSKFTLYV